MLTAASSTQTIRWDTPKYQVMTTQTHQSTRWWQQSQAISSSAFAYIPNYAFLCTASQVSYFPRALRIHVRFFWSIVFYLNYSTVRLMKPWVICLIDKKVQSWFASINVNARVPTDRWKVIAPRLSLVYSEITWLNCFCTKVVSSHFSVIQKRTIRTVYTSFPVVSSRQHSACARCHLRIGRWDGLKSAGHGCNTGALS